MLRFSRQVLSCFGRSAAYLTDSSSTALILPSRGTDSDCGWEAVSRYIGRVPHPGEATRKRYGRNHEEHWKAHFCRCDRVCCNESRTRSACGCAFVSALNRLERLSLWGTASSGRALSVCTRFLTELPPSSASSGYCGLPAFRFIK